MLAHLCCNLVDEQGQNQAALKLAAAGGKDDMVKLLVEKGASLSAKKVSESFYEGAMLLACRLRDVRARARACVCVMSPCAHFTRVVVWLLCVVIRL